MIEPLRILHLTDRLDGYGAAHMLRELAARQAADGNRVTIAALSAEAGVVDRLRARNVEVRSFSRRAAFDPLAVSQLTWLSHRAPADLVHAWDPLLLAVAALARRRNASRLVATLALRHARRPWSARMMQRLHSRVDRFIAADQITRAELAGLGIDDSSVVEILPGVAPPVAPLCHRSESLFELALPPDARIIAVAGPLVRSKNVEQAIWSYELVRVLHPDARLLIFGDGPDRLRLERFAAQVSDLGHVRFLGFRNDLVELLAIVDVFWQLDSPVTTPLALLEAMAAGIPCVATDVPAHRDVVADDLTGYLVPQAKRAGVTRATDDLLKDAESANRIGAAAAGVAGRRSLAQSLDAYQRLYGEVLARDS